MPGLVINFVKKIISNLDHRGETLVEAIVAIFILSMALIPILSVVLFTSGFSSAIKNNLIAANLAQEGVEVVRAIRDANWLDPTSPPFYRYLIDCGGASTCDWRVDYNSTVPLSLIDNPPLKISSAGLYNYVDGGDSIFRRKITITNTDPMGCNCELLVVSEVTWPERNRLRSVKVESHLFNWR